MNQPETQLFSGEIEEWGLKDKRPAVEVMGIKVDRPFEDLDFTQSDTRLLTHNGGAKESTRILRLKKNERHINLEREHAPHQA